MNCYEASLRSVNSIDIVRGLRRAFP